MNDGFQIPVGSRVALKDECAGLYKHTYAETEGVVSDHRLDAYGYPMVYIKWDADHWRYQGQTDGWTFEQHFRIVGLTEAQTENLIQIKEQFEEGPIEEPSIVDQIPIPSLHDDESLTNLLRSFRESTDSRYVEQLGRAIDAVQDGEAFITIAVSSMPDPEGKGNILVPSIYSGALNAKAALLLGAQMSQLAASGHLNAASQLIDIINKGMQDDDDDKKGS